MAAIRIASIGLLVVASFEAAQQPLYRSRTQAVPIYATVTGADGRLLPGLSQDDFTVLDDGRPRPIAVFSDKPAPIVGLAMWDVSPAMRRSHERSREAARAFVEALWPDDRIRFGTFSGQEFAVSPLLTSDKPTLHRVIQEELWSSETGTPLWAALQRALAILSTDPDRRVLVVLNAGKSNLDPGSKRAAVREMHRTNCMICAIGLEGAGLSADIQEVAADSGGGYVQLGNTADLNQQFTAIITELHHQYLLGFVSDREDGLSHTLTVRTRIPGSRVRARRSYIAEKGALR